MAASFKVESLSDRDRTLWECVSSERYQDLAEIERSAHQAGIQLKSDSLALRMHHFRKQGWVDGHEKHDKWMFIRNDPRARRLPALVGVSVPVPPPETPEDKLLREIDGVMEAAMDLASRAERLKSQIAAGAADQGRVTALEEENKILKAELERLSVFKAAFRAALED